MFDTNKIIAATTACGFTGAYLRPGKVEHISSIILPGLTNSIADLDRMEAAIDTIEAAGVEVIGIGTNHAENNADYIGGRIMLRLAS